MISTVFEWFAQVFATLWNDLEMINTKVPVIDITLGMFVIASVYRFILRPMLKAGLSGSDSANGERKEKRRKKT